MIAELIDADGCVLVERGMCGHCRGDMFLSALVVDGQEIQCRICGEMLWFQVRNGCVIQHPGRRPVGLLPTA